MESLRMRRLVCCEIRCEKGDLCVHAHHTGAGELMVARCNENVIRHASLPMFNNQARGLMARMTSSTNSVESYFVTAVYSLRRPKM